LLGILHHHIWPQQLSNDEDEDVIIIIRRVMNSK
jgi:hypothetical protein